MRAHLGRGWSAAAVAAAALAASACEDPVVKAFDYAASSPIYSTPAITPDAIIFGSENGEVVALNKGGEFLWKYATRRDVVGAVKVAEGMVLFGSTNNTFYALDMAGREVWKYTTLARIKGDPLVVGKTVIFGSYDKHLYALSITTGKREWIFPDDDQGAPAAETPAPAPAPDKGAKPAAAAPAPEAAPAEEKVIPMEPFSYSSPVLVGEDVVVGNMDGSIYAVNARTGKFHWRFRTEGADKKKGVTSTVVETADALVFGANDGNVYALSKDGKAVKWKFKTNDEVNATAITDAQGNLYIGGVDQVFYALDASGKERWRFQLKGPVMGRAAILDNLVIFAGGAGDNTVYAVDRDTGKPFWSYLTNGKIETDVVAEGNRAFVASEDRRLFCFEFKKTREK